ncbi:MAG: FHA domain-containing protein [Propionibacteriaceae bacterium]|nr:FHA domain-containing protein [Propionibacteriaceae bacterium]
MWDHTGTDSVESAAVRHVGGDSDQAPVPKPPPPSKPAEHPSPGEPADKPGGGAGVTLPEPPPVRVRGNAGLPVDSTLVIETDEDEAPQGFGKAVVGGEEVDIHDTVVIGRAPSPIPGEQCTLLRASHERSISRSHVLLRVVGDEVVAIDLGSNNGTKLLRPGQPDQMVTTTPVLVHDGDTLDLGESVHVRLVGLP